MYVKKNLMLSLAMIALAFPLMFEGTASAVWTTMTPMPVVRANDTVVGLNGLLYAVGGTDYSCGAYSALEPYNPLTNAWTTEASMHTPRWSLSSGVVNGILYAVGGSNGCYMPPQGMNTLESYNPTTNTWTAKANMPTARFGLAVDVVNGILYAVGGEANGIAVATVEAYDPTTNTWTTKASMPTARANLAVGVVNGILYAVGGIDSTNSIYYATVEAYNPITNSWTTKASMPTARYQLAVGVVNNILYAVGGINSGGSLIATVEAYDPATSLPTISGTPATNDTVGSAYSFTPTAINATTFTITGSVPPGLTFNSTTGTLSGTPTTAGTYTNIVISGTDSSGTVSLPAFTITVPSGSASATPVGYNPQWLIITLVSLTLVGGYLLRKRRQRT